MSDGTIVKPEIPDEGTQTKGRRGGVLTVFILSLGLLHDFVPLTDAAHALLRILEIAILRVLIECLLRRTSGHNERENSGNPTTVQLQLQNVAATRIPSQRLPNPASHPASHTRLGIIDAAPRWTMDGEDER